MEFKGMVQYLNLVDWWQETFSKQETVQIVADCDRDMGATRTVVLGDECDDHEAELETEADRYSTSAVNFTMDLSGWTLGHYEVGPNNTFTADVDALNSERCRFLSGLAQQYFRSPTDWFLAEKLLNGAEEFGVAGGATLDVHFVYQNMIQSIYKMRDRDGFLDRAVEACEKQIALAPEAAKAFESEGFLPLPAHIGFNQLRVILKKQKRWEEHNALCREAERQGWNGNWKTAGV